MEYRTLEITLQDAKDLNKVNLFTKMDVYAVVSISGGDKKSKQKTKSPVDHIGDANPTWNFPMKFTVDESALQMNRLTLDFKLVCERALGDKDVGQVSVPIKELLDSPAKGGGDGKQFVSYQVRKPSGKPKGQITFSYQLSEKTLGAATSAPPYGSSVPFGSEPVSAYPAGSDSAYPPPGSYPTGSSSYYSPPPGSYPRPAPYTAADGNGNYLPPAPYTAAEGAGHYPPPAGYPPSGSGPPPPPAGYPPAPPPAAGYPPAGYGYPPPPPAYGYPQPPAPGYGYQQQQPGYGYAPPQQVVKPPKKNKFGMGLGAGLLGGAIGGLLVGDMISDGADFDCGGFDF